MPHAPSQAVEVVDRHGHTLFHLPLLSDEAPDACAPDVRDFVARFGHADRGHRVATRLDGGLQALAQVVVQRAVERLARPLRALDGPHGPLRAGQWRVGRVSAVHETMIELDLGPPGLPLPAELPLPAPVLCSGHAGPALPPPAMRFHAGERLGVRVRALGPPVRVELQPQAALLVLQPQGRDVLALVGGYGGAGGLDRVTRSMREAGSAFVPFIYGAALQSGAFTPATFIDASPLSLPAPGDAPPGRQRLRQALATGNAAAALRLLALVGPERVRAFAERLGIPEAQIGRDLDLAAHARATPWQLAAAYAALADTQRGRYLPPRLLDEEDAPPAAGQADLSPQVAYLMSSMLHSVVDAGTATEAQVAGVGDLAGKGATTPGGRDIWFIGYHADLLCAVWLGYEADAPERFDSSHAAMAVFVEFMHAAGEFLGRPPPPLPRPPGLREVELLDGQVELEFAAPPGKRGRQQ